MFCEPIVPGVAAAESACLSHFFACLDYACRPLTISACPSLLNTTYNHFAGLSQMLLTFKVYSPELFLEQLATAGSKAFGIVPPFNVVNLVLLPLSAAVHEPWVLSLPVLRAAVLRGKVEFEALPDVLPEMIRAWPDIRAFLKLH